MKFIITVFFLALAFLMPVKTNLYTVAMPDAQVESLDYQVQSEKHPNFINKSWREIVKTQQILTLKISKTLRNIKNNNSPDILLFGLGIAFLYGIIHAIGPGHSKTIVASYFLSNQSKILKPIIMAMQISFMHCLSAVAFVFLADVSLRKILVNPDEEIKIISLVSYALIFLVGIYLIISKLRGKKDKSCCCEKNSGMLALSAGLIPCTGALIIMLYAMANQMIMTGILLVAAISAGIAVTIAIVGILSNIANKALVSGVSMINNKTSKILIFIEYTGFGIITLIGLVMFLITLS